MANKTEEKKGGVNPMVASLAGAAVGAAVGAGAIILSDKKNRKKLEDALDMLKKQGFNVLEIVQREAESVRKQLAPADEKSTTRPSSGGKKGGAKKK